MIVTYKQGSISNLHKPGSIGRVETVGLREAKKTQTRLALRDAAVELFVTNGYDATTVAEIAAKARVSEPTFFRYYPTKAAVVLAPLEHRIDRTISALEELPVELLPLDACVQTAQSAEAIDLLPAPIEAPYLRELRETPSLRSAMLDCFDIATDRLSADFARRLRLQPDDLVVRQTASAVVATLQEVFFQWAADTDDFDIGVAAVESFQRLRSGLR